MTTELSPTGPDASHYVRGVGDVPDNCSGHEHGVLTGGSVMPRDVMQWRRDRLAAVKVAVAAKAARSATAKQGRKK